MAKHISSDPSLPDASSSPVVGVAKCTIASAAPCPVAQTASPVVGIDPLLGVGILSSGHGGKIKVLQDPLTVRHGGTGTCTQRSLNLIRLA